LESRNASSRDGNLPTSEGFIDSITVSTDVAAVPLPPSIVSQIIGLGFLRCLAGSKNVKPPAWRDYCHQINGYWNVSRRIIVGSDIAAYCIT
jgi:hypothetical protein